VSPRFYSKHPNPYIKLFTRLAYGPNTFHQPRIGVLEEYTNEMNAAFDSIWLGQQTPEVALAQVERRIQPKFERELRQMERIRLVKRSGVERF
jgi:maltose-binding protein MalE